MTNPLNVTSADLNELADQHRTIASDIDKAHEATDGATFTVGRTHGIVCSMTIAALYAAQDARAAAATALSGYSHDLAAKLDSAATQYTATDTQQGGNLDGQMHK